MNKKLLLSRAHLALVCCLYSATQLSYIKSRSKFQGLTTYVNIKNISLLRLQAGFHTHEGYIPEMAVNRKIGT
jgi:hypothetical protein